MPHAIQSTFFEPLVHGLDLMLAKAERVIARQPMKPEPAALKATHHRDLVNLPGVIEQVAAHFKDYAEARSIHFSIDVAPDALVVGDFHELYRVVEQFLISALENTTYGGCVTVTGAESDGIVTLSFSSLSPATPSRGLARFQDGPDEVGQVLSCLPSDIGQILRAHGGHMKMFKQRGLGPYFVIRLPVGNSLVRQTFVDRKVNR